MKQLFILFIISAFFNSFAIAQNCIGAAELIIWNQYVNNLQIKVTPVGSIFSGKYQSSSTKHKYTFYPSRENTNIEKL